MTDALTVLAALHPHHPNTVVGSRYAVLFVPLDALKAAQALVPDNGPFDLEAARLAHTQDRAAYYQGLTPDELRSVL